MLSRRTDRRLTQRMIDDQFRTLCRAKRSSGQVAARKSAIKMAFLMR
jgi:hypothetical protein